MLGESLNHRRRRAVAVIGGSAALLGVVALVYAAPSFRSLQSAVLPLAGPALHTTMDEVVKFDFLDPVHGWAAAAPSTTSSRIFIYATSDGARSWHQTGAISGLPGAYPVAAFRFFDRSRGVIAVGGNELIAYRTADGGRTWTRIDLPANTWFLTFAGPDHAWATTPYAPVFMRAYMTVDGGSTWVPLPKLPVEGSLDFSSPTDGWLSDADGPLLFRTDDGGLTWARVELPGPPPRPGFFSDYGPTISTLEGGGVVARDFSNEAEFVSFDAGATWRSVMLPPGVVDYSSLDYQDSVHWWDISGSELFKTADAGLTWTMASDHVEYGDLRPVIVDAQHAWAELQAADDTSPGQRPNTFWQLDMTSDGGLTWTSVTVPVPI